MHDSLAGLIWGGADKLLFIMEQEARNYLQTPTGKKRLIPLLEWAEKITKDSTGDIKPVAKRAIALANALDRFIDCSQQLQQASTMAEVFTQTDFPQLTRQLEALKNQIPSPQQSTAIKLKFIDTVRGLWLDAFQLTPELINLSLEEAIEIDQKYFYLNWLIIQCKEAAVKVSPKTWQEIEDKMLRV